VQGKREDASMTGSMNFTKHLLHPLLMHVPHTTREDIVISAYMNNPATANNTYVRIIESAPHASCMHTANNYVPIEPSTL
jgi:hypothetical protein